MVVIIASSQHDAAVHLDAYGEGIKHAMRVSCKKTCSRGCKSKPAELGQLSTVTPRLLLHRAFYL